MAYLTIFEPAHYKYLFDNSLNLFSSGSITKEVCLRICSLTMSHCPFEGFAICWLVNAPGPKNQNKIHNWFLANVQRYIANRG